MFFFEDFESQRWSKGQVWVFLMCGLGSVIMVVLPRLFVSEMVVSLKRLRTTAVLDFKRWVYLHDSSHHSLETNPGPVLRRVFGGDLFSIIAFKSSNYVTVCFSQKHPVKILLLLLRKYISEPVLFTFTRVII